MIDKSSDIDLTQLLKIHPEIGRLQFSDNFVSLLHVSALARLREEITEKIGQRKSAGLFFELGYESGQRDAETCKKLYKPGSLSKAYNLGHQARTVRGILSTEIITQEIDEHAPLFYEERSFSGNFEVDSLRESQGLSRKPTCWMQVGYMSGFSSAVFGFDVLYKEVECQGSGHENCRIVGQLFSKWNADEIEEELSIIDSKHYGRPIPSELNPLKYRRSERGKIPHFNGIIGRSQKIQECFDKIEQVSSTDTSVLLLGETGVGKERFAKTIHNLSSRRENPFIAVNCSAIPDELVESELFGVTKGAYTDARESRPGRFERADSGTLFLDEIGDLSWEAQTKLLLPIQERVIERLGGSASIPIDVRLIAATSIDLHEAVRNNKFRPDLLYRINVFPISIPPLRNRKDDIPILTDYYVSHFCEKYKKKLDGISKKAIDALSKHSFQGNVRELENLIERAIIVAEEGDILDVGHLFLPQSRVVGNTAGSESEEAKKLFDKLIDVIKDSSTKYSEIQKMYLEETVAKHEGNISRASRKLGMTRVKLDYRLKKHRE